MIPLVATLVFAGLAVYLWRECKPFLHRALSARESQVQAVLESTKPEPPTPREALPPSIRVICEQWRDPWAREQAMDYYCELHDQTKDWNAVQTLALADEARSFTAPLI